MKKSIEPIIMAVALGLLGLGAAAMAFFFPSVQDITSVSGTSAKGKIPPKVNAEDIDASLAPWKTPVEWKVPENQHRLFISDGFLFFASLYPDGKYIVPNSADARTPSGVLINWYQKYSIDFTNPAADREDPDNDGFSNIVEFKNEQTKAAEADGSKSTNPLDPQSHPSFFSRLRLQKFDSRPFHIQFRGYQQVNGVYEFQIYLKDVPSFKQPKLLKTGDPLGSEGYVIGAFNLKMVEEEDPATHIKAQVDESTLELLKPDIGFKITLTYRKEVDSPESTANFVVLMPTEVGKTIDVPRGKTFALPEDPGTSYQMIDAKSDGANIRDVKTKQELHVPNLDQAELGEVPEAPAKSP